MWFKNLHLYRLHGVQLLSPEQTATVLAEHAAKPLGNADARRIGWTAPAGRLGGGQLLHTLQNDAHRLISALCQERLLEWLGGETERQPAADKGEVQP